MTAAPEQANMQAGHSAAARRERLASVAKVVESAPPLTTQQAATLRAAPLGGGIDRGVTPPHRYGFDLDRAADDLLRRSTAAQGLPLRVEDPETLRRLAAVVRSSPAGVKA